MYSTVYMSWLFNYYVVHRLTALLGVWTPYHKLPPPPPIPLPLYSSHTLI